MNKTTEHSRVPSSTSCSSLARIPGPSHTVCDICQTRGAAAQVQCNHETVCLWDTCRSPYPTPHDTTHHIYT